MASLADAISQREQLVLPPYGDLDEIAKVQVDGLVVLKIIKHARDNSHESAQGLLFGLANKDRLEVTYCFPHPSIPVDEEDPETFAQQYQETMTRCLRDVNIDYSNVGWYQSTVLGNFITEDVIRTQFDFQTTMPESVMLVYDAARTAQGWLWLKAFRLTDKFMELLSREDFSPASIKKAQVSHGSIFQEVDIELHNHHLLRAFLTEIHHTVNPKEAHSVMDLPTHTFLEKNIQYLGECVEELSSEMQKYQGYQRALIKQQHDEQQFIQKKKQEQAERQKGGSSQPSSSTQDDLTQFKAPPPPSMLDGLLITAQVNSYCRQISQFANQSFGKLYVAKGLQPQ